MPPYSAASSIKPYTQRLSCCLFLRLLKSHSTLLMTGLVVHVAEGMGRRWTVVLRHGQCKVGSIGAFESLASLRLNYFDCAGTGCQWTSTSMMAFGLTWNLATLVAASSTTLAGKRLLGKSTKRLRAGARTCGRIQGISMPWDHISFGGRRSAAVVS